MAGIFLLCGTMRIAQAAEENPPSDPAKMAEWIKEKQREAMAQAQAAMSQSTLTQSQSHVPKRSDDDDDDDEAEPLVQIPARDEKQIARARAVTLERNALPTEISSIAAVLARSIDPTARLEAAKVAERCHGDVRLLANAAAVAWVQQCPEQALFLAAEAAKAGPDDPNALNTLGALLAHAGYGHKGIPLLAYLARTLPYERTILSNLGVAWLNLGDTEEAKIYLTRCLARAPGHGAANLAAGIIAEAEGRKAEAIQHFRRATKSNSSPLARKILRGLKESHGVPKGFFGMLPKKEYFSPGAFEPVRPQKSLDQFDLKKAEKAGYEKELAKQIAGQERIYQEEMLKLMGNMTAGTGARNVYANLDWTNYMKSLDEEARLGQANRRLALRQKSIRELRVKLETGPIVGTYTEDIPMCVRRRPMARAALDKMAVEYEKMVAETLYIWRDTTNARLTYLQFISPPAMYRGSFATNVVAYLEFVRKLNSELPLVADPCADVDLLGGPQYELAPPGPGDCPFSVEMNLGIVELHMDCTNFGFDFEAGLAFSVNKNFPSGETTLTAGVGAKMDLGGVGKAAVSGQMVVVWDGSNDLSFVGVEAIAGAKISGIPGLSGELAGDTLDLGREPGADSEGPSLTVSGDNLTKDLVKVGSETRLGVTIGPSGVDPSLSGSISSQVLGQDIFEIKL